MELNSIVIFQESVLIYALIYNLMKKPLADRIQQNQ